MAANVFLRRSQTRLLTLQLDISAERTLQNSLFFNERPRICRQHSGVGGCNAGIDPPARPKYLLNRNRRRRCAIASQRRTRNTQAGIPLPASTLKRTLGSRKFLATGRDRWIALKSEPQERFEILRRGLNE
jgi:hypothetical protein